MVHFTSPSPRYIGQLGDFGLQPHPHQVSLPPTRECGKVMFSGFLSVPGGGGGACPCSSRFSHQMSAGPKEVTCQVPILVSGLGEWVTLVPGLGGGGTLVPGRGWGGQDTCLYQVCGRRGTPTFGGTLPPTHPKKRKFGKICVRKKKCWAKKSFLGDFFLHQKSTRK